MIDFHSHILPGIDDGSKDVAETLALLNLLKDQGVRTVVATPHFYADDERAERFLERRAQAKALLTDKIPAGMNIVCGAEVAYYPGISRLPNLSALCIENSKLLLLEMPMSKWTDYTVKELIELSGRGDITVVIAHIERYMGYQSHDTLRLLRANGILLQCNASFFLRLTTKGKALSMLKKGEIHFIGSDCHNLTHRAPHIGQAFEWIEKKCGKIFLEDLLNFGKAKLH